MPSSLTKFEQLRFAWDSSELIAGKITPECANKPDNIQTEAVATQFATLPGGSLPVSVAGAQQWSVFDLFANGPLDIPHFHEMVNYQAVLFTIMPTAFTTPRAAATSTPHSYYMAIGQRVPGVLSYAAGEVGVYDEAQGKFTTTVLEDPAYDLQTVGGGFEAEQVLIPNKQMVNLYTLATGEMTPLVDLRQIIPGLNFAGARDVTILGAYRQTATGPVLMLTSDEYGDELYTVDPADTFQRNRVIGGTGLQANKVTNVRQVRCLVPICAVSHFGGLRYNGGAYEYDPGGITIIKWSGSGDYTDGSVVATLPLGDEANPSGVVGIDLIGDGRGNVAIAAAGFSSGVIYETVVDENGAVLRSASQAVPEACINPGHVKYLVDPEGLKTIATCYNSSNYVVANSQL